MSKELKYVQPSDEEVVKYICAWDGDITEKTARYLLEIDFWKDLARELESEPKPGEFTKEFRKAKCKDCLRILGTGDRITDMITEACGRIDRQVAEIAQLKRALGHPEPEDSDRQYMFCAYCGFEGPCTIDELQQHVLSCDKHPIAKLQADLKAKEGLLKEAKPFIEGIEFMMKSNSPWKRLQVSGKSDLGKRIEQALKDNDAK